MMKKKIKEIQKANTQRDQNSSNSPLRNQIKEKLDNGCKLHVTSKKNLPELHLSKLKARLPSETDKIEINTENLKKPNQNIQPKKRSISQMKNGETIFPKLNKNNGFDFNNKGKLNIDCLKKTTNQFSTEKENNIPLLTNKTNNNVTKPLIKKALDNKRLKIMGKNSSRKEIFQSPNFSNLHILKNNTKEIKENNQNQIKDRKEIQNLKEKMNKKNREIKNKCDKELKELNSMSEKLNMLTTLFNSLNSLSFKGNNNINSSPSPNPNPPTCLASTLNNPILSPLLAIDSLFPPKPTVELSSMILKQEFKNFRDAIGCYHLEIPPNELIKAYSYNTSQGNVRDYNEDTITAKYVNDNFYFFGVYDGHGGNGCSMFLRDNLHKYIDSFSVKGIKDAINQAENIFITTKAQKSEDNLEINDSSGSCGVMALIKGEKCIIANVGDSRCVIFKKNKVEFATEDHKPDSPVEKARISKAGGEIYQTPSFFPLYQNGKIIEAPWRVRPGGLSVSRTFGDIEAKDPRFGGKKGVVAAIPDIKEFTINNDFNFICLACDGIFDVLSNEEILQCASYALKEYKDEDVNKQCKEISNMIIKAAMAKDSFDNISCVIIAINLDDININI